MYGSVLILIKHFFVRKLLIINLLSMWKFYFFMLNWIFLLQISFFCNCIICLWCVFSEKLKTFVFLTFIIFLKNEQTNKQNVTLHKSYRYTRFNIGLPEYRNKFWGKLDMHYFHLNKVIKLNNNNTHSNWTKQVNRY